MHDENDRPVSIGDWVDQGGSVVIGLWDEPDEPGYKYAAKAYRSGTAIEDGIEAYGGFCDSVNHALLNLAGAMSGGLDEPLLLNQLDEFYFRMSEEVRPEIFLECTRELFRKLAEVAQELTVFAQGASQITPNKRDLMRYQCLTAIETLRNIKNRLSTEKQADGEESLPGEN
jgi:hypothetical protein